MDCNHQHKIKTPQTFKDGSKHIKVCCANCGSFIKWEGDSVAKKKSKAKKAYDKMSFRKASRMAMYSGCISESSFRSAVC